MKNAEKFNKKVRETVDEKDLQSFFTVIEKISKLTSEEILKF